jgi:hypothetical protein
LYTKKSSDIKKDIQGSGKAAFPGEKKITDESPRMENIDFDDDFEEFNHKEVSNDPSETEEVDINVNIRNQEEE